MKLCNDTQQTIAEWMATQLTSARREGITKNSIADILHCSASSIEKKTSMKGKRELTASQFFIMCRELDLDIMELLLNLGLVSDPVITARTDDSMPEHVSLAVRTLRALPQDCSNELREACRIALSLAVEEQ